MQASRFASRLARWRARAPSSWMFDTKSPWTRTKSPEIMLRLSKSRRKSPIELASETRMNSREVKGEMWLPGLQREDSWM